MSVLSNNSVGGITDAAVTAAQSGTVSARLRGAQLESEKKRIYVGSNDVIIGDGLRLFKADNSNGSNKVLLTATDTQIRDTTTRWWGLEIPYYRPLNLLIRNQHDVAFSFNVHTGFGDWASYGQLTLYQKNSFAASSFLIITTEDLPPDSGDLSPSAPRMISLPPLRGGKWCIFSFTASSTPTLGDILMRGTG